MEGSESPRRVINPSPAPRLDPRPTSVAIRTPTHRQSRRIPDRPILRNGVPASILIEVVVSRHIRADVLPRTGVLVPPVTLTAPLVKAVWAGDADRTDLHRVGARQHHGLSAPQSLIEAIPGNLHLSLVHRDQRPVLIGIGVHAVATGLHNRHRRVGSVHFHFAAGTKVVSRDPQRALRQPKLQHLVGQVGSGEVALLGHSYRDIAGLQLGARPIVRPEAISRGERVIQRGLAPVVLAGGFEGNGAFDVAEAGHSSGRVAAVLSEHRHRHQQRQEEEERNQNLRPRAYGSHWLVLLTNGCSTLTMRCSIITACSTWNIPALYSNTAAKR